MTVLNIPNRTKDRYHALSISKVWNRETVRSARSLIIGAGALGNEVAKNLAMMGVPFIAVVDRDIVETANLTRSIFFRESDHGRPKVAALAERVTEFNPDTVVLPLEGELEDVLGLGLLRRMDLVFSCLDNRQARRALNRMCERVARPWVDGSMEDLFGEVSVYVPGLGACYECTLSSIDLMILTNATSCRGIALQRLQAGKIPTTSSMGSIIAAMQVQEALKLIHGREHQAMIGKRLAVNCLINNFYAVDLERNETCPGHFRIGQVTEVPEFSAATTSPLDLLKRFRSETGTDGYVELGREVVTELRCAKCQTSEKLLQPLRQIQEADARCAVCDEVRVPETTHMVTGTEHFAGLALQQIGIPRLDIVEVRSPETVRWYELSGDLAAMPEMIHPESVASRS